MQNLDSKTTFWGKKSGHFLGKKREVLIAMFSLNDCFKEFLDNF